MRRGVRIPAGGMAATDSADIRLDVHPQCSGESNGGKNKLKPGVLGVPADYSMGNNTSSAASQQHITWTEVQTRSPEDAFEQAGQHAAAKKRARDEQVYDLDPVERKKREAIKASEERSWYRLTNVGVVAFSLGCCVAFTGTVVAYGRADWIRDRKPVTTADNPRLGDPFHPDTVPTPALFVIAAVVSLLLFFTNRSQSAVLCPALPRWVVAAYFWGVVLLAETFHFIFKLYVARPRPCFYDLCGYDESKQCTSDLRKIRVAYTSFPSGHATSIAAIFAFLIQDSDSGAVVGLSFLFGLWVILSRITDNRHDPADVLTGCGLGGGSAFVGYRHLLQLYHRDRRAAWCEAEAGGAVGREKIAGQLPSSSSRAAEIELQAL
ncbi:unnamed protein product [Amoebophrya sp. A120]|nr:unnamed protein product [Amoebophrya sp. A120]|eukprot:GSA120T00012648001.1